MRKRSQLKLIGYLYITIGMKINEIIFYNNCYSNYTEINEMIYYLIILWIIQIYIL